MKWVHNIYYLLLFLVLMGCYTKEGTGRIVRDFNKDWSFKPGDHPGAKHPEFDAAAWRTLNLPHDWSIEGEFSIEHPTKPEGGSLPAGIGWYRKTFKIPGNWRRKVVSLQFDGIYRNSEVWINGLYLGKRPYGYSSFAYALSPHLKYGEEENVIAVKVDNAAQPNSRWYTGSGIYRNVRLVALSKAHIAHWGTFVTTPEISPEKAEVNLQVTLNNEYATDASLKVVTTLVDSGKLEVASVEDTLTLKSMDSTTIQQRLKVQDPVLWAVENPYLYSVITKLYHEDTLVDTYHTPLGIRFFEFNAKNGFSLNGKPTKIHGVCLHHDLGALGAAFNIHAAQRQLKILKEMGVNAIRTAHNPPAPEVLDLCDRMGFIVQDEAFDVWKKRKVREDYHKDWDEWHARDLADMVLRDRNHPSVMMWSIGNEIPEQFDSSGIGMTTELARLVKSLDNTRPVTSAITENNPEKNYIYQSGALDLLGFNYKHGDYEDLPRRFPDEKLIASENVSGLATRGHYDMPSDTIMRWPPAHKAPFDGNPDYTVSAYDQVSAYWGSTHEENWKTVKKLDFMAGLFVWTGFDYLGEPIPYPYPARSSYFGIIDLAGFPKDVYYMYQSEWTDKPVLHIFPHWNWRKGERIDVWAYYNNADEVELFLNGKSLGVKAKKADDLHVFWRIAYAPGTLKAISRKDGKVVLEKTIKTAGDAASIALVADRQKIKADGYGMSFITVSVLDKEGTPVPRASNLIEFEISGAGKIAGVDNGYQAGLESFKALKRKAYNGKCLVIVQSDGRGGPIHLTATSGGLEKGSITIETTARDID